MRAPLVSRPHAASAVLAGCVVVVAALGALVHDASRGNWFDDAVLHAIRSAVPLGVQVTALHLTDAPLVVVALALTALGCAARRRWDAVALVVAAPALAVLVSEYLIKPLVGRSNVIVTERLGLSDTLAYPSGHETGLAALAAVLSILLLGSAAPRGSKLLGVVGLAAVVVAGAIGLVGQFFHYATDTIGAVGVATAVTLAAALAVDRISRRPRGSRSAGRQWSPWRRRPPRANDAAARRRPA